MNILTSPIKTKPYRILHTMIRTSNLERSIEFYCLTLGMTEFRRETFPEGKFTLVFLGYNEEMTDSVIELTYNWGEENYDHGNAFGHIALAVEDIDEACRELADRNIKILRHPGPMTFAPKETGERDIIAFISDPDGYRIELIQMAKSNQRKAIVNSAMKWL